MPASLPNQISGSHPRTHKSTTPNGTLNGHLKFTRHHSPSPPPRFREKGRNRFGHPPRWTFYAAYITTYLYALWGWIHDWLITHGLERCFMPMEAPKLRDFVPLYSGFESFYIRHIYRRMKHCFNRPVCSSAGAEIDVLERRPYDSNFSYELTGRVCHAINMGSYNYLGFCEPSGGPAHDAERALIEEGVGVASSRQSLGTNHLVRQLERKVASYVEKEDAIVFQMGFATNHLNIPSLFGPRTCVLSDSLNHASLVLGIRLSGATVKVFKHNDTASLERCLQEAILEGRARFQDRGGRSSRTKGTVQPFTKIVIVVEGIYSMEGSIVNLPEVIRLKKKYNAYLYLDEAHSIGAIGPHGRGVVDYFGASFHDVDIMMGTFTKSFAAAGGYIAGTRTLINYLRKYSHSSIYGTAMSPPVAQQILSTMHLLLGEDGTHDGRRRIEQLAWNTRYFRRRLHEMGLVVYGCDDSPVVPVLFYVSGLMGIFSTEMLKRGIALVVAGLPATAINECRARFCLSSGHTKEMLDHVLEAVDEVTKLMRIRFSTLPSSEFPEVYPHPSFPPIQSPLPQKVPQSSIEEDRLSKLEMKSGISVPLTGLNGLLKPHANGDVALPHPTVSGLVELCSAAD